jgi:hypothetical protein
MEMVTIRSPRIAMTSWQPKRVTDSKTPTNRIWRWLTVWLVLMAFPFLNFLAVSSTLYILNLRYYFIVPHYG